ncbi:MAG: hypothetical protein BGP14_18550 [Sphingobacteriales bacterium 44-15]|nr:MAG: hypothetical protein BGP14_18550 [Sphingobacteriales bacterium 44-15]
MLAVKVQRATMLNCKWALYAPMSAREPDNQNFDYCYWFICQRRDNTYYSSLLPHVSLQAPQKWIDYYHKKFGMKSRSREALISPAVTLMPLALL